MAEHFQGIVYRALNPTWAAMPLSGAGAARYGGRFNPKSLPTIYVALSPVTAMREANRAGSFQPITLIAIRTRIARVFDACDPDALASQSISPEIIAMPDWRSRMIAGQAVATHALALSLIDQGYDAIVSPSFAPGATPACRTMAIWLNAQNTKLEVIDDENRLRPI